MTHPSPQDSTNITTEQLEQQFFEALELYFKDRHFSAALLFKEAADLNHSLSMFMMGILHHKGHGVERDRDLAEEWLSKAAALNNGWAKYILDDTSDLETSTKIHNSLSSLRTLLKAKSGDSYEQYAMGINYLHGDGMIKDPEEAVKWFTLSAEQGCEFAEYQLGLCYKSGEGVKQNMVEAIRYLRKSAVQNYAEAQYELALFYKKISTGTEREGQLEALYWMRQAAKKGIVKARYEMACAYYYGEFLKHDFSMARRWLESTLGFMYPPGLHLLGVLYRDGKCGSIDMELAEKLFNKAAELGHTDSIEALFLLGKAYELGNNTTKNLSYAIRLYKRAAEYGHTDSPTAIYSIGRNYELGTGIQKNEHLAVELYHAAADYDSLDAIVALARCYGNGIGVETDDYKSFAYCLTAAEMNDSKSQRIVADSYLCGYHVPKNLHLAKYWYKKATQQGDSIAQEKYDVIVRNEENQDSSKTHNWFKAIIAPYEKKHKLQDEINRLVDYCVYRNLKHHILFESKQEIIEAIFFIWSAVKKVSEERQSQHVNINAYAHILAKCLESFGIDKKDIPALINTWVEKRLVSYSQIEMKEGFFDDDLDWDIDYAQWGELLEKFITSSNQTNLHKSALIKTFKEDISEDEDEENPTTYGYILGIWGMIINRERVFDHLAKLVADFDK